MGALEKGRLLTTLAILSNPPPPGGRPLSYMVLDIVYVHAEDGKVYEHEFGPGVEMWALKNGSIVLRLPGKRIWEDIT